MNRKTEWKRGRIAGMRGFVYMCVWDWMEDGSMFVVCKDGRGWFMWWNGEKLWGKRGGLSVGSSLAYCRYAAQPLTTFPPRNAAPAFRTVGHPILNHSHACIALGKECQDGYISCSHSPSFANPLHQDKTIPFITTLVLRQGIKKKCYLHPHSQRLLHYSNLTGASEKCDIAFPFHSIIHFLDLTISFQ